MMTIRARIFAKKPFQNQSFGKTPALPLYLAYHSFYGI